MRCLSSFIGWAATRFSASPDGHCWTIPSGWYSKHGMSTRRSFRCYVAGLWLNGQGSEGAQWDTWTLTKCLLLWRPGSTYKTPLPSFLKRSIQEAALAMSGLSSSSKAIPLWYPHSSCMRPNKTCTQSTDIIPCSPFLTQTRAICPQDVLDLQEKI